VTLSAMRALSLAILLASTAACDRAPEVDPAAAEAKLRTDLDNAATRARNNKSKDAEKIYTRVLEEHPDQPEALAGLAKLRFSDGKIDEALAMVDKSIADKGDVAQAHGLRGEILARKEQHAEAAAAYGKAFELTPEKSEYGLPYGVQLKKAGSLPEAEKVLRKVAELDPMAQFVFTELGDVLRAQERLDESLKTYMKALSTYASDKMAHAGAAQIYEAKGDIKHALDEWSQYVRMDCCSQYSESVAKKKIESLQAASNELDKRAPAPPTDVEGEPEGEPARAG
jgi:tetratricopeptide (TPR) repeat protein